MAVILSPAVLARHAARALDPGLPLHYSSSGEAVKVNWLAWLLGTLSGLRFVAPEMPATTTIVTALAMHVTHAMICRIFALQSGRDGRAWTIAGLIGGVIATTVLLVGNEIDAARSAARPR